MTVNCLFDREVNKTNDKQTNTLYMSNTNMLFYNYMILHNTTI